MKVLLIVLSLLAWNISILVSRFYFHIGSLTIRNYAMGVFFSIAIIAMIVDFKKFAKVPVKVSK